MRSNFCLYLNENFIFWLASASSNGCALEAAREYRIELTHVASMRSLYNTG